MMMNESIMEVREDFMLSPAGDSKPTLRTAHFLKPISNSKTTHQILSPSSVFDPKELPLNFHFHGWRQPQKKWVYWVDSLKQRYESVWKKAGIFEAIMCSKCHITKNKDLLFGVVQKWCCETNTFVFPWGEATITLEDVMVLGGFPVLGDHPAFTKLETQEMREVEEKLFVATMQPWKSQNAWMDIFMDNKGSEIEHEAFLATWLSFFVFPHNGFIKTSLLPTAIHLARGFPIALAPPVLASIYSDLGLFKKTIVDYGLTKNDSVLGSSTLEVSLKSPLVQIWVFERFINLQPVPNLINHEDPLLFRWHNVKVLKFDNVSLAMALNSADDFVWRPYVRYAHNCNTFYPKDGIWVTFETDLDKKLLSFVTCIRVSELVGIDAIEQYLPHRVAMLFGMDQDVPGCVPRFNDNKSIAWENYCRRICDKNLYVPSRLFEGDVTIGYAKWWKQSILGQKSSFESVVKRKRSASPSEHRSKAWNIDTVIIGKPCDDSSSKARKLDDICADVTSGPIPKSLKTVPSDCSVPDGLKGDENIEVDAPTRGLEEGFEDANGSKESRLDQGESHNHASEVKAMELEERIGRLEIVITELKIKRFGHS